MKYILTLISASMYGCMFAIPVNDHLTTFGKTILILLFGIVGSLLGVWALEYDKVPK